MSARPSQWIKNFVIYLAFFFSVGQAWAPHEITSAVSLLGKISVAFLLFCVLTGSVYIVNDVADIDRDKSHPIKRFRPIASGNLSPYLAIAVSIAMALFAVVAGLMFHVQFGLISIAYLITMLAYNAYLKHMIIVDVMIISFGFVLRAMAGALVLEVTISVWLYICTSLGALFIGFSKRLSELVSSSGSVHLQRPLLNLYTPRLLEQIIAVLAAATLISYALYTFSSTSLPDNHAMMLTIPFVMYGIFRYLYLVEVRHLGEAPEHIALTDTPLIITFIAWLLCSTTILILFG